MGKAMRNQVNQYVRRYTGLNFPSLADREEAVYNYIAQFLDVNHTWTEGDYYRFFLESLGSMK